nr:exostosin-like 2 [Nerophis lumbriciformis]
MTAYLDDPYDTGGLLCRCSAPRNRGWLAFWSVLLLFSVVAAITAFQHFHYDSKQKQEDLTNIKTEHLTNIKTEEFTIILQTYKRDNILLKVLKNCLAAPHLQKIIVVWNNIGVAPSQKLIDSLGQHSIPVLFMEQTRNSLQNRLQPFAEIHTEAVLMLDDDVLVSVPDISFAFIVWQQFRDQIVGFVPRKHVEISPGVYNYEDVGLTPGQRGERKYSMVLIGAAFFHRRYLKLYRDQPKAMHDLVEAGHNCEDIAMNFVVSLHLREIWADGRSAGIYVKPMDMRNLEMQASGDFKGLWHRSDHFKQRSECINQLTKIYGVMPLQLSDIIVNQYSRVK